MPSKLSRMKVDQAQSRENTTFTTYKLDINSTWKTSSYQLLVLVVQFVSLFYCIEDFLGHASQVEGSVRSIGAAGPTAPSITTTVSGVLAQKWVADWKWNRYNKYVSDETERVGKSLIWLEVGSLTSSQSEEDNDGSKSEEKSGAKVERKPSVGVTVRVVAGVGVVVVLLGVSTTTGGLVSERSLDLPFCPNTGKKEEREWKS